MPFYKATFQDWETSAVADDYETAISIIVADTAGHRVRLRSLQVGQSDDSPTDENYSVRITRADRTGDGTAGSTIAAANVPKVDPSSLDCIATVGLAYTVEPSTLDTEESWAIECNSRGGFIKEWEPDMAIIANQDTILCVQIAPRAAAAIQLSGTIEFETF